MLAKRRTRRHRRSRSPASTGDPEQRLHLNRTVRAAIARLAGAPAQSSRCAHSATNGGSPPASAFAPPSIGGDLIGRAVDLAQ